MPDPRTTPDAPAPGSVAAGGAIGVAIVAFNSSDVIADCLDSLLASDHPDLRIVICDNASSDDTVATIRAWASDRGCVFEEIAVAPGASARVDEYAKVALLRSPVNTGYAGGVNVCLRALLPHAAIDLFWVLNPDSTATPATASAYARAAAAAGPFALMGGRVVYQEPPHRIQSDGGVLSRWTGMCRNINRGVPPEEAARPQAAELDFISGANVVASRAFIESVGLMAEEFFLYYEEVEWALRRGGLPLLLCEDALVRHHGGTAIGSASADRRASSFSNYFNFRNRMWLVRRINPVALPVAYVWSSLQIAKLAAEGDREAAAGAFRGLNQLPPPRAVRDRIAPDARRLAFGRHGGAAAENAAS